MRKYEYQLTKMPKGQTTRQIEDFLWDLGSDGWELCGIDYGCFILKRARDQHDKDDGRWVFERSSGYDGLRCVGCGSWVYADGERICKC